MTRREGRKSSPPGAHGSKQVAHEKWARPFLFASTFLTGAALMVTEIVASRVIAPVFGNTLFCWTGIIGTILAALSLGYYLGGIKADASPTFRRLAGVLIVSGLALLVVPVLAPVVLGLLEGRLGMASGPLLSSLLLFVPAAVALGMVPPLAVRIASDELARVGRVSGTVSMLSALGSIIGTFLAGFVLVPLMETSTIFISVGGLVLAMGLAAGALVLKSSLAKGRAAAILAGWLVLTLIGASADLLPFDPREGRLLFDRDSFYHHVRVTERETGRGPMRILTLDTTQEGAIFLGSDDMVFQYTRFYPIAELFAGTLERALFLGGGAYAMPIQLAKRHPWATVDVIEIDPLVQQVGEEYFGASDLQNMRLFTGDSRLFLSASKEQYDTIFGDCYRGVQNIPFHLVTEEFFQEVAAHLTPNGVFAMNLISGLYGPTSALFDAIHASLSAVFANVYVFRATAMSHSAPSNIVLVATPGGRRLSRQELLARAADSDELRRLAGQLVVVPAAQASLAFTDDYAPVEALIAGTLVSGRY